MGCPSVITLEITDGVIPSVMFPRETFFWRARIRRCFRRWLVFLFATELTTEMEFTDYCYTDGRDPSVTPSVLLLPMDFIAVTDGISPSVKLDNVVVKKPYKFTKPYKPFQSKPKIKFDPKNITCYKCNQKGHTSRFCKVNTKLHKL